MNPTLAPLRAAALGEAEAEAAQILAAAREEARAARAEAELAAAKAIREGGRLGREGVAEEVSAARAEGRAEARSLVLEARRHVYESFRSQAHAAALRLCDQPDYPDMLERLRARALARLGPGAAVQQDTRAGGLVATAGPRRLDYTLPALVERCIDQLGDKIGELWE